MPMCYVTHLDYLHYGTNNWGNIMQFAKSMPILNVIAGIYMYMDAHARNGGFLTRGSCLLVRKGLIQSNVSFASNSH